MKKYAISNLIFTFSFIVFFSPLCYLLIQYVLDYSVPTVEAKKSLNDLNIQPITISRDFSNITNNNKVTVLMYHQIIPKKQLKKQHFNEDGELNDMIVTLEDFTKQMDYLKENQYTTLTLKEFEKFMKNEIKVPEKSVFITFDDGYKNVIEYAYPVLKERGFYATQFLITGVITNRTVPYDTLSLQYASIDELKNTSDVFDYGNHTNNLHNKNSDGVSLVIASEEDKVKKDFEVANNWLGHSIAFAAPYGEYDTSTLNILRELQISMAFTVEQGYAEPSQHILEIPRFGIFPFYSMEDFITIVEQRKTKDNFQS